MEGRKPQEMKSNKKNPTGFKSFKAGFLKYSANHAGPSLYIKARDTRIMTRQIAYLLKPDPAFPAYRIFRKSTATPTTEEPHEKEIREEMHNETMMI